MTPRKLTAQSHKAFLIALAFWLLGWFWKIKFLVVEVFLTGLIVEIHHPLFPSFMLRGDLAFALYLAPLLLALPLLRGFTRRKAIALATILALSSLGLLGHINTYNDATFTTCFWSALWLLWLAINGDRQDKNLAREAKWLARATVAMIFLGGAVGKFTAEYWSGQVFYTIYFEDKDYFLYEWLRQVASPGTRFTLAVLLSRAAIIGETFLGLAIILPYRWYGRLAIFTMVSMVLISTFNLFSVMFPLIGILLANLAWRTKTRALPS